MGSEETKGLVRAFAAGGGVTLRWVYLVRARPLVPTTTAIELPPKPPPGEHEAAEPHAKYPIARVEPRGVEPPTSTVRV